MRAKAKTLLHDFAGKIQWAASLEDMPAFCGCILSNELLDNFSVHRVRMEDELMECYVDYVNGNFTEQWQPAPCELKEYLHRYHITLSKGFRTEINLEAECWIQSAAAALAKGFIITIDYGNQAQVLYHSGKCQGTMMCYQKHSRNEDPYDQPGCQDITFHVDFSALLEAGSNAGLQCCGFTTQAYFLRSLGLTEQIRQIEKQALSNAETSLLLFAITNLFIGVLTATAQKKDSAVLPPAAKSHKRFCNVRGWHGNEKPVAPPGFVVTLFADNLENPRSMYETAGGDVLVVEANTKFTLLTRIAAVIAGAAKSENLHKSANRVTLLRNAHHEGLPQVRKILLTGLDQPFGILTMSGYLYVANTGALLRFPYNTGDLQVNGPGETVMHLPLSKANRHWTRNLLAAPDASKVYIAVGSGDNVGEFGLDKEINRACILEVSPDGTGLRVYASGLRNPVGLAWAPGTHDLYAAVNERDGLGDVLVPDYLTHVKENGFYGWPYAYFGAHMDKRVKEQRPDLVAKSIVPDVSLAAHTASLGLAFYTQHSFPEKYRNGAFIAQHGSYDRSALTGYKVVFVPFANGKPSGAPEDFLTGFIMDHKKATVHGRPVGVLALSDGSLLVTDDITGKIWRVAYEAAK
jgi:glucose/arabinose dehydrogenase